MQDVIFEDFLTTQRDAGLALAAESDLLSLQPLDGPPTQRYVATYRCKGLALDAGQVAGRINTTNGMEGVSILGGNPGNDC